MKQIYKEILRLLPFLGLAAIVLIGDDSRHVVLFGTAIIFLAVGIAHAVRKIIFPYIDIEILLKEVVQQNSIASATVILGFIYMFTNIIQALITLLK